MATITMLPQFYHGRGVNSTSGKPYGQAIEFDSPQTVVSGQMTALRLESVSSSRELTEKLDISATASLLMKAWGASAEFNLTKSREINNYYTYALVRVIVENAPTVLRNPRLRPEARELLIQKGWEEFAAAYGWEYIDGIITGGSYYALIEIQTNNETDQLNVKSKLSGYYGPFKADASVATAFQEIAKTIVMNVLVIQAGGSGDIIETTLEDMIKQAIEFPVLVQQAPVSIAVTTADYQSTVPLPLNVPLPDSLPRRQQKDTLEDLSRAYLELRDYKASVQFVLDHLQECDDFRYLEPGALEEKRTAYKKSLEDTAAEIDKIVRQAEECAEDYYRCQTYIQPIQFLPLLRIGAKLLTHSVTLDQDIEYTGTTTDTQGKFVIVNGSLFTFTSSDRPIEIELRFDHVYLDYPLGPTAMWLDIGIVLDNLPLAVTRSRSPRAPGGLKTSVPSLAAGTHTLNLEARTVLGGGPPISCRMCGTAILTVAPYT